MQKVVDLFQPDPKELVRKWQRGLKADQRALDRQIRDIQFQEKKVHKAIKDAAKRGDVSSAKSLAKEVVQSRRVVARLYTNKAQLISLGVSLTEQLALVKVTGTLSKSTEVMKMVNKAMKLPELQKSMMEMSKEMMKAGIIEEMVMDAMDSALDTEDMEEETEEQVEKILAEIGVETLASMPNATKVKKPAAKEEVQEEEDEMDALQQRLDAVRA